MKLVAMLVSTMLAAGLAQPAAAAVTVREIAVKNAGFEIDPPGDGQFCRGCNDFWNATSVGVPAGYSASGQGKLNPLTSAGYSAPEGDVFAFVDTFFADGTPTQGGLLNILDEDVVLGTTYSMTVDVLRRPGVQFADWVAEIVAGDGSTVVAQATLASDAVQSGSFTPLTVQYTGAADRVGQQLGIRFRSFYNPTQGSEYRGVGLDNVRMTATSDVVAAVPEPATWATMLLGFGMIGAASRRRSRSGKNVLA